MFLEAAGYQGTIGTSGSMSLNKSCKSISMEDMRVSNARYEEITDDDFDDDEEDEDLQESNFYKARDFNQSFRAAVDKSYDNPSISSMGLSNT